VPQDRPQSKRFRLPIFSNVLPFCFFIFLFFYFLFLIFIHNFFNIISSAAAVPLVGELMIATFPPLEFSYTISKENPWYHFTLISTFLSLLSSSLSYSLTLSLTRMY
jgi:hypothetical protein